VDNHRIASEGRWSGTVNIAGAETTQSFEIFNSNGAFQVILGKPWLRGIQAVHKYETDLITIQMKGKTTTISKDGAMRGDRHTPGPEKQQERTHERSGQVRGAAERHRPEEQEGEGKQR